VRDRRAARFGHGWTVWNDGPHDDAVIEDDFIPVDAIVCPSCSAPNTALEPVYVRDPGPGVSLTQRGLTCRACWPPDNGCPAKYVGPRSYS